MEAMPSPSGSPVLRIAAAAAFLFVLAFILWGSLTPVVAPGGGRYDKLQHFAAYAVLTATALVALPRRRWTVLLLVIGIGATVEVLQGLLPLRRSASGLDLLADAAGAASALLVASFVPRRR